MYGHSGTTNIVCTRISVIGDRMVKSVTIFSAGATNAGSAMSGSKGLEQMPPHVMQNIMKYLDVGDITKLSATSKTMRYTTEDRSFLNAKLGIIHCVLQECRGGAAIIFNRRLFSRSQVAHDVVKYVNSGALFGKKDVLPSGTETHFTTSIHRIVDFIGIGLRFDAITAWMIKHHPDTLDGILTQVSLQMRTSSGIRRHVDFPSRPTVPDQVLYRYIEICDRSVPGRLYDIIDDGHTTGGMGSIQFWRCLFLCRGVNVLKHIITTNENARTMLKSKIWIGNKGLPIVLSLLMRKDSGSLPYTTLFCDIVEEFNYLYTDFNQDHLKAALVMMIRRCPPDGVRNVMHCLSIPWHVLKEMDLLYHFEMAGPDIASLVQTMKRCKIES